MTEPLSDYFDRACAKYKPEKDYKKRVGYTVSKLEDTILSAQHYTGDAHANSYVFDFLNRVVTVRTAYNGGSGVIPFSQYDRESLEWHFKKMVELGGTPPALPPATDPAKNKSGLNL